MDTNEKSPKTQSDFFCLNCHYITCSLKDYNKHCSTDKHTRLTNTNDLSQKSQKIFKCICGKEYKHMASLCKHKKVCCKIITTNSENLENLSKKELSLKIDKLTDVILEVVGKNNELTKQIIELSTKTNVNNSFNNNKTFNLQFFLNEECKNALNIRDFVESIQVQLSDLENTGKLGYVEGIAQIFINNLKQLENTDRPIHCSDYKRETLYIKNDNEWIKETDDKINIKNAIKQVANKNIKQIKNWQEKHPDYNNPDSKQNDKYMKIVLNSMSGSTEEEQKNNINKIIKNVAKEVIIEKS
jgi:hypothetical protein